jgi:hypothetical protein
LPLSRQNRLHVRLPDRLRPELDLQPLDGVIGSDLAEDHLQEFEALLREVARTGGLPITRVHAGSSEMLLLEGLLALMRRHGVLDDRLVFTLELVFGRGGANLRNRTAHGWLQRSECTPELSNRLMQLLLAIGLPRKTERPPSA